MKTTEITINLTNEKSEELFYNALCGADVLAGYGLSLTYEKEEYQNAKKALSENPNPICRICREDVWLQILRSGGTLTVIDHEGDYEEHSITIKEVHERVQDTDIEYLMQAINQKGDGTTDDVILQTVFFNEVIFG